MHQLLLLIICIIYFSKINKIDPYYRTNYKVRKEKVIKEIQYHIDIKKKYIYEVIVIL